MRVPLGCAAGRRREVAQTSTHTPGRMMASGVSPSARHERSDCRHLPAISSSTGLSNSVNVPFITSHLQYAVSGAIIVAYHVVDEARSGPGNREGIHMPASDYEVLDPRFGKLFNGNAGVRQLYEGCQWAEGPVWFAAGRYLLWS